jgi:hypothetical protein
VEAVGSKEQSARGHFQNSCITVTEAWLGYWWSKKGLFDLHMNRNTRNT